MEIFQECLRTVHYSISVRSEYLLLPVTSFWWCHSDSLPLPERAYVHRIQCCHLLITTETRIADRTGCQWPSRSSKVN